MSEPVTREELAEALREANPEQYPLNTMGGCARCGTWENDPSEHFPNCTWVKARAILSRLDAEQKGDES